MNAFHGTTALLRAQLRVIRPLLIVVGALALVTGLLLRLGSADRDSVQASLLAAGAITLLVCPLLAGSGLTLPLSAGSNNAGFSRRDALLLLPTGRLAIPTTVFVGSLLATLGLMVVTLAGLGLTLGPGRVWEGLNHAVDLDDLFTALPCAAGAWLVLTSLTAIGPHRAATLVVWLGPPGALLGLMPAMGYDGQAQRWFALLVGAPLALIFLVFPFVLYGRPRHLWFTAKKDMTAGFDSWVSGAALLVALLFGIGGVRWGALGALLGVVPVVRAWRKAPPAQRVRWSSLRLAHTLCALAVGGTLLLGAGIDRAWVASLDDPTQGAVDRVALAPGGRYAALEVARLLPGLDPSLALRRVHLIDLRGQEPPRVFPQRFAALAQSPWSVEDTCWSRDGRYLALVDQGLGRVCVGVPVTNGITYLQHQAPWQVRGAALLISLTEATIFDTHTGETQVVEGALFAPGWRTPADLARLSLDLRGRLVVRTGHGAELRLDPLRVEQVMVNGYSEQGPLLATSEPKQLEVGDRLPAGSVLSAATMCLTPQGVTSPPAETPEGWRIDTVYLGPQPPGVRAFEHVVTDGRREHRFPADQALVPLIGQPSEGRVLVLEDQTRLRELELETRVWRDVMTADEGARLVDVRSLDGGVFFRHRLVWHWYRPGDGQVRRLPEWVHVPYGWLPDGTLLAQDGERGGLPYVVGEERRLLVSLGR